MHREIPLKNQSSRRIDANEIAIAGLQFIVGDDERLHRFMALTGIDPGNIREASREAGFALAVLDFIGHDDSTVLAFAAESGLKPDEIARARAKLAGPEWSGD